MRQSDYKLLLNVKCQIKSLQRKIKLEQFFFNVYFINST